MDNCGFEINFCRVKILVRQKVLQVIVAAITKMRGIKFLQTRPEARSKLMVKVFKSVSNYKFYITSLFVKYTMRSINKLNPYR